MARKSSPAQSFQMGPPFNLKIRHFQRLSIFIRGIKTRNWRKISTAARFYRSASQAWNEMKSRIGEYFHSSYFIIIIIILLACLAGCILLPVVCCAPSGELCCCCCCCWPMFSSRSPKRESSPLIQPKRIKMNAVCRLESARILLFDIRLDEILLNIYIS